MTLRDQSLDYVFRRLAGGLHPLNLGLVERVGKPAASE
jgi:hypothetical protein